MPRLRQDVLRVMRPSSVDVARPSGTPGWLLRVMVVVALVVFFLSVWWVANAIIHPPPPKCFTDSNMAMDPTLPCYTPAA
jgi:hypothetical protein